MAVTGVLIPTNEVAGDSFDYAVNGNLLHIAIVDAMGHGMDATLMSVVAIGAFRNARRTGLDLLDTARSVDRHIASQFGPGGFVTGILGELDASTGVWRWLSAGPPPALWVRDGHAVKILGRGE
nr:PP2C family protein-serine/threonine phosphatase [Micromonospora sp. DSM 115978]